ncbi:AEC family transporter [Aquibacillus albus]|uniref:Permease n=1 Tax=Aquibacillus albus TaxID=1168171 RepID=A0ABS2MYD7_9BACI|nr:AEC family transporter [Aquibacillus albus]MBM7570854.1 putative permease [Aquibacillus albus]
MDSFNYQFLYSVMIIAIGYILKRAHIFKQKDGDSIARIIFNVTLPALLIYTFSDFQFKPSLFVLIIIGLVYGFFICFIGLFVFRKESRQTKGMLVMMMPGFNIGLFAYPLVEGIWGQEGIQHFGMLDVGNAFVIFGLSYFIGSYYSSGQATLNVKTIPLKMSKSIPFMTYIGVCTLNIIGWQLPNIVVDVSSIVSKANMPLSLLLLGIYLSFTFEKSDRKLVLKYLGVRYLVGLAIGLVLFFLLPYDDMFKYTVLISLILPTAISALPYAAEFNYNRKLIGTISNIMIIISFVLMWIIANLIM